jgi:hypothetical protein
MSGTLPATVGSSAPRSTWLQQVVAQGWNHILQWPLWGFLTPGQGSNLSFNKENLGKWAKNFGIALLGFLLMVGIFLLWGDQLKPGWFLFVVVMIFLFPVGMVWSIGGMIVALFQKPE